jgi:hypothetical protein
MDEPGADETRESAIQRFELGPLAPGTYSLRASQPGTYVDSETVELEAARKTSCSA